MATSSSAPPHYSDLSEGTEKAAADPAQQALHGAAVSQPPPVVQQLPVQQLPAKSEAIQAWPPGQAYTYPAGPVQYVAAPQIGYQYPNMAVVQPPPYEGPHDFLLLSVLVTIFCAIFNVLSLALGIPAIVLAAQSSHWKSKRNYPQAKKYGLAALLVTVANIAFTLVFALFSIGLSVGCYLSAFYKGGIYGCFP